MAERPVTIPVPDEMRERIMEGKVTGIDMEALLWQLRDAIERQDL